MTIANDTWHRSLTDSAARFYFGNAGTTYFGSQNGYIFRNSADNVDLLTITNAGDVGIGTSPGHKLHVYSNSNTALYASISNANTGGGAYSILNQYCGGRYVDRYVSYAGQFLLENASGIVNRYSDFDTHYFRNGAGSVNNLTANSSGIITPAAVYWGTSVGLLTHDGTNAYVQSGSGGALIMRTNNGTEAARFTSAGYLGVGTTSAIRPLQVYGEMSMQAYAGHDAYFNVHDSAGSNGGSKSLYIRGLGTSGSVGLNLSYVQIATNTLNVPGAAEVNSLKIGSGASATNWPGATYVETTQSGNIGFGVGSTWVNLINSGSVGANGQIWHVTGYGQITDTASGNASMGVRLFDGASNTVIGQAYAHTGGGASYNIMVPVSAVISLTAATTFYLQAIDFSSASGLSYDGLTRLHAIRIA